ncbi:superinfection immunity protein [Streptomyces sp. NPDC001591]|uniref:superinfection immunity protein n=1 Tax=Streptomyces sp. NPDC001591 TaxID=3364589 RepID=UPI0036805729
MRSGQACETRRTSLPIAVLVLRVGGDVVSLSAALPIALVVLVLYLVPTVVAMVRAVPNRGSVIVVNIFLGWTLIGWVVALAMAARSKAPVL